MNEWMNEFTNHQIYQLHLNPHFLSSLLLSTFSVDLIPSPLLKDLAPEIIFPTPVSIVSPTLLDHSPQ